MTRGILDSLDDLIAVIDESGRITAVNRAWERFDRDRAAAGLLAARVGDNYFHVLRDAAAKGHDFGVAGEEAIRSVLEGCAPLATLDYQLGSGVDRRWHLERVMPLEGGGQGAVVSHQDITDRMMAHVALDSAHRRLQALFSRVVQVQEEERRTISLELHDDVGQNLAALKIGLHRLKHDQDVGDSPVLSECIDTTEITLERLRSMTQELRPPQLDQLGLAEALRWFVERQRRVTGVDFLCSFEGLDRRPPQDLESACYRIAQEGINNATRHGRPGRVTLRIEREERLLKLIIHDDGVGFDEAAAHSRAVRSGSLGLIAMEERARVAGGRLKVRSVMGGGTTVIALFPVE